MYSTPPPLLFQQHSKGSSEGSGIIPEVPDKPKDNFGSSSSSLSGFDDEVQDVSSDEKNKADEKQSRFKSCRETSWRCTTSLTVSSAEYIEIQSMVDVPIHQADPVVQRTRLIDTVISMVIEKSTPTPPPPTTQAQVTNVFKSDSSSKFEQRISELEKKIKAILKRAWTEKDQKRTDEMVQMIVNLLLKRRFKRSLECYVGGRTIETNYRLCRILQSLARWPTLLQLLHLSVDCLCFCLLSAVVGLIVLG
ncbi:hypothetical protein Tco_1361094 [Tanacetum coccineum]